MSGVEGWIEWHGGENPVPCPIVETRRRDGLFSESCASDLIFWDHQGRGSDIIAYRVVTPAPSALQPSASVPAEQADGGGPADVSATPLGWVKRINEDHPIGLMQPSDWRFSPHKPTLEEGLKAEWFDVLPVYATPPATPIAEGFGSSSPKSEDTHRAAETAVPFDWTDQELIDLIGDAISDSMDMDWTSTDGAKAALAALQKEGLLRTDVPPLPVTSDRWADLERLAKTAIQARTALDSQDAKDDLHDAIGPHKVLELITAARRAGEPGAISSAELIARTDYAKDAIDDRGGGRGA